jgi:hypothetical protein
MTNRRNQTSPLASSAFTLKNGTPCIEGPERVAIYQMPAIENFPCTGNPVDSPLLRSAAVGSSTTGSRASSRKIRSRDSHPPTLWAAPSPLTRRGKSD